MENGEYGLSEPKENIVTVYSDFMMRIAQFDELVSMGSQLLVSFHQALGFLGRASIDKTSKLVERIINAHGSKRVLSYFEAGCANSHDSLQNVSKLFLILLLSILLVLLRSSIICKFLAEVHTCHLGLQHYIKKAKVVIDELEFLVGNATSVVQTSMEKDEDISCNLDSFTASMDQERPNVADYASIMVIIYNMVKQDFTMQLRIVCSLNHKSSQGELETYCQMWSLRPFIDDEITRKAWNLVPRG